MTNHEQNNRLYKAGFINKKELENAIVDEKQLMEWLKEEDPHYLRLVLARWINGNSELAETLVQAVELILKGRGNEIPMSEM